MSDFHCCTDGCCPENQQLKQDIWNEKEKLESELSAARKCVEALRKIAERKIKWENTLTIEIQMKAKEALSAYDRAMGGEE